MVPDSELVLKIVLVLKGFVCHALLEVGDRDIYALHCYPILPPSNSELHAYFSSHLLISQQPCGLVETAWLSSDSLTGLDLLSKQSCTSG